MNNPIDKLLTEWAYRVHDGMPDPKNPYHMVKLEEAMTSMELPRIFQESLLMRLRGIEESEKLVPNPKPGKQRKKMVTLAYARQFLAKQGKSVGDMSDEELAKAAEESGKSEPKTEKERKKIKGMTLESIDGIDGTAKDGLFKGETTAPGTVSSAINEIGTGYGMAVLNENPNMTQEQVMAAVQAIITKKGGPKLSKKHLQSIANSARREHTRTHDHMERNGMNPETTTVSHIWGAKESLAATAKKLEELRDGEPPVTHVNGVDIDKYIKIVSGGGGGGDPTDTMILMVDDSQKPPKVEILHTSNKMSNADIQANSGPTESLAQMDKRIDNSDLSDEEKAAAKAETNKVRNKIKENDKEIGRVVGAQSDKFDKTLKDDASAKRMVDSLLGKGPVEVSTSKGKYWEKGVMTNGAVKDEMKAKYGKDWKKKLTDEDKIQMVRTYAKDIQQKVQNGEEITKNDQRILIAFGEGEDKINGTGEKTDPPFAESDVNKLYQEQFNSMNNMRKILNEKHNGMGDEMFKSEMITRMHLDVAEGHNPGSRKDDPNTPEDESSPGIPTQNFELNMGRNESSIKYDKNTGEMYQRVGKKYIKIDPETGKPKVGKDGKEIEGKRSDMGEGDTATIASPEIISECITGKKPPLEQGTLQNSIKVDEKAEQEMDEDGKSRQTTYIVYDLEGREVCKQTVRSKSGLGGKAQDTLQWSDDMMSCMQRKSYLKSKGNK